MRLIYRDELDGHMFRHELDFHLDSRDNRLLCIGQCILVSLIL